LAHERNKRGLRFDQQRTLPVLYDSLRIDAGLRIDLLVEERVIVEFKAVERLLPVHRAQALTHLKLTGLRPALLINFNVPLIRDGIQRVIL